MLRYLSLILNDHVTIEDRTAVRQPFYYYILLLYMIWQHDDWMLLLNIKALIYKLCIRSDERTQSHDLFAIISLNTYNYNVYSLHLDYYENTLHAIKIEKKNQQKSTNLIIMFRSI